MNAAAGALILDGVTMLLNLTVRLIEAREQAAAGMAASDENADAELDAAAAALSSAITRANGLLEGGAP